MFLVIRKFSGVSNDSFVGEDKYGPLGSLDELKKPPHNKGQPAPVLTPAQRALVIAQNCFYWTILIERENGCRSYYSQDNR